MGQLSDRWAREHAWRMGSTMYSIHSKAGLPLLVGSKLFDEARKHWNYYSSNTWKGVFFSPDRDVYIEAFIAAYTAGAQPKDVLGETDDYDA